MWSLVMKVGLVVDEFFLKIPKDWISLPQARLRKQCTKTRKMQRTKGLALRDESGNDDGE